MDVTAAFRVQSRACGEHGSPMYADLLARAADDVEAGGPTAEVVRGHEDDPANRALALRLMGSVHRLVLERRAGGLAAYFPSVGGRWEPTGCWAAFRRLLAEQREDVAAGLDRPPQTNEVGRAAALYGALLQGPRDLPVRLTEIGASAGLNLRADRFGYLAAGRVLGDAASRVRLDPAWAGRALEPWPDLRVVERAGCDTHPVDAGTTTGRTLLTAYVWADQGERLERLRAALSVAARVPVALRRQDAASFVDSLDLGEGTTTVVWHSVVWQYLTPEVRSRVEERLEDLGRSARETRRLVHVAMEPGRRDVEDRLVFSVTLRSWPGGSTRRLGTSVPHGIPTTWH